MSTSNYNNAVTTTLLHTGQHWWALSMFRRKEVCLRLLVRKHWYKSFTARVWATSWKYGMIQSFKSLYSLAKFWWHFCNKLSRLREHFDWVRLPLLRRKRISTHFFKWESLYWGGKARVHAPLSHWNEWCLNREAQHQIENHRYLKACLTI